MGIKLTQKYIDSIVEKSELEVFETHTTTIVALTLPNGFTIVKSSACISPENYDKQIGIEIALNRIKDEIWKFEGYKINDVINELVNISDTV